MHMTNVSIHRAEHNQTQENVQRNLNEKKNEIQYSIYRQSQIKQLQNTGK